MRFEVAVGYALLATGCGRVAFDPLSADAPVDSLGTFGAVIALEALNTGSNESDPSISSDGLEIFFDSNRPGSAGDDIYTSRRATRSDVWSPPTRIVELSTANNEVSSSISADGLTLYFSRNGGGTNFDVFVTTRPDRDSPWATPQIVPELNSQQDDTNISVSADGLEMWMASRRQGEPARQMYLATRPTTAAPWGTPVRVDALNYMMMDAVYTADPWPLPDGSGIYFVSDRPGSQMFDIWFATRPTPTTFGTPELVMELASPFVEHDPTLTLDLRELYFTSRSDLYVTVR